ncbi:MAG: hypothetical protein JXK95_13100 [Bacteroidales bacterium]|nr:hypothetical protein [Bacteroidales bacterium]
MKKTAFLLTVFLFLAPAGLMANKTGVEIKAPSEVKKGSEVTIKISVTHKGNSKFHFTDWVVLKINGEEVKKWQYDKANLPPDDDFVVEYKVVVTADLTIEAQGNCNLHGSTGIEKAVIKAL